MATTIWSDNVYTRVLVEDRGENLFSFFLSLSLFFLQKELSRIFIIILLYFWLVNCRFIYKYIYTNVSGYSKTLLIRFISVGRGIPARQVRSKILDNNITFYIASNRVWRIKYTPFHMREPKTKYFEIH